MLVVRWRYERLSPLSLQLADLMMVKLLGRDLDFILMRPLPEEELDEAMVRSVAAQAKIRLKKSQNVFILTLKSFSESAPGELQKGGPRLCKM